MCQKLKCKPTFKYMRKFIDTASVPIYLRVSSEYVNL